MDCLPLIAFWIIFLNNVWTTRNEEILKYQKDDTYHTITNYADCLRYKLLVENSQNISLTDAQQTCNNVFYEQRKTWFKRMRDPNIANYVRHLLRGVHSDIAKFRKRKKRSIFHGGIQTRKEVREPPYDENWGCYVRGVRRLKENYDVVPYMNTYDVIANLHTADEVIPTAHDGPGFFSWHREYLRIMELAIGCPIPYWDTTPDYAMSDPTESIIWSDRYFGNPYGLVTTGIMKNLPSVLPIIRNCNSGGWLVSRKDISMALSKPSLFKFTEASPCRQFDRTKYSWECFHKGIHDWIDGTIGPSNTTTFDPIFFPIHAFVDKIFELFRQKLIANGVDPEKTYPLKGIKNHGPNHKMIWIPLYQDVEHLTNSEGYGDELASLTKYSVGPKCPHCYHSDDLYCSKSMNICVSKTRETKDEHTLTTVAILTKDGIKLQEILEPETPEKVKRLINKTGPLPFGTKFKVGSRDHRTRRDSIITI